MNVIREFAVEDWAAVWSILEPVFRAGETYVFSPDISETEARQIWIALPNKTYVVTIDGVIVGTYYLKPNQPGLGNHIGNCGYIVAASARGRGVASQMCEHSQWMAKAMGFRALQFNFVVSTNEDAVRLWTKHGFQTLARLPAAFRHPRYSYVDALIMYKSLME